MTFEAKKTENGAFRVTVDQRLTTGAPKGVLSGKRDKDWFETFIVRPIEKEFGPLSEEDREALYALKP